jgi:hypothetical protein
MSLMWFLKQLAGPKSSGFLAYLISRNQNKSRIELEKARQETATDLIDRLPDGAVYREAQQMDREVSIQVSLASIIQGLGESGY